MYAFGIICYQCWTGTIPFKAMKKANFYAEVIHGNARPPWSPHTKQGFRSAQAATLRALVVKCWDADHAARPTAREAFEVVDALENEVLSDEAPEKGNHSSVWLPDVVSRMVDRAMPHQHHQRPSPISSGVEAVLPHHHQES